MEMNMASPKKELAKIILKVSKYKKEAMPTTTEGFDSALKSAAADAMKAIKASDANAFRWALKDFCELMICGNPDELESGEEISDSE
jgi:hypothetical protein